MANPFSWLSKVFAGDPGYTGPNYSNPVPIDPGVFDYGSWKDRTLANRQYMGMVPTELPIPGYAEDRMMYKGQGPGYQPLHERTQTMYVNPALAGTSAYESYYPKARRDIETGELVGDTSRKEIFRKNEALFPPQITNPYPFDPDYAALWAGDQYTERVGDEPAFYDATQMYTDKMTDDYVNWLETNRKDHGPWNPGSTLGSYFPGEDRITFNVGAIRGAGPEMIGGSGIDRFGHEQRQEWDAPGRWDINQPHWRNLMDEVVRHELKHSAEKEFGGIVPYPVEEQINPMTRRMENFPHLDATLHREIYMGDPIWNKGHSRANVYNQGLPATWRESENVMAMHNWAKDQYLSPQPAERSERPNMRDVAGPVRREPVTYDRGTFNAPPSQYHQQPRGTERFNTGGIVSLMI